MSETFVKTNPRISFSSFVKLIKIEGKLALREPIGLVFGVGLPILLLVIFGNVPTFTSKVPGTDVTIFELYVPILIVLVLIMVGLMSLPLPLARNREIGWLRRISTTPVSPFRLLAAQIVINLLMGVIAIFVLLIGSHVIFGIAVPSQILGFVLSIVLTTVSLFSLGLLIGSVAPTQGIASVLANVLLYPFLFFSGVYIPVSFLPNSLQTISSLTPVGAAVKALTDSMQGIFPSAFSLLVLMVYTVLFIVMAARFFRWQ